VSEPLTPSVGWGVLHLFCRPRPGAEAKPVIAGVAELAGAADHQVVPFAVLGHKAELGFMAVGPDLWRLQRFQAGLVAAGLEVVDSYVSLTEVSEYSQGMPEERLRERLYPTLPPAGKRVLCFYPMSKRRSPGANWFTLPFDQRKELMYGHGAKGREYAGRVVQLITGSTGLDDWEWGVTLFADDPVSLKQIVYEMRFDPASALYAKFGRFVTGLIGPVEEVLAGVGLPDG
jgi:hydrogen peroxide-dependent heme synthase